MHITHGMLRRGFAIAMILALAANLLSTPSASAQVFTSGSNGTDGALNLTTPGTIIFDPRTFNPPLDPDGDNIYHFTTINIAAGVTVRLRGPELHMKPVFWLATGDVQIDGIIDLNGEDGQSNNGSITNSGARVSALPGAGGFSGGVPGESLATSGYSGYGPGGGKGTDANSGIGAGGAGHVTVGKPNGGPGVGGSAYGNDFILPLIGGSGGGSNQGGGGAGGGALLLASSTTIRVNGVIRANGGVPGLSNVGGYAAGAGSGGSIRLIAPQISGAGSLSAIGGETLASDGRIRLEAFLQNFSGSSAPAHLWRTPLNLFLPTAQPSVRIVSIGGTPSPAIPQGNYTTPDVVINSAGPVTVAVEGRNIPLGSIVHLHFVSENGPDILADTTPLAGLLATSTATAQVTLPSGYSRMFVRTTWTP